MFLVCNISWVLLIGNQEQGERERERERERENEREQQASEEIPSFARFIESSKSRSFPHEAAKCYRKAICYDVTGKNPILAAGCGEGRKKSVGLKTRRNKGKEKREGEGGCMLLRRITCLKELVNVVEKPTYCHNVLKANASASQ